MTQHLKGHASLADMVSAHIAVYRELLLKALRETRDDADNTSYLRHELRALDDIEAACNIEKR